MNQSSDRISCPKCQAANFASSAVCWQCGEPLSRPQVQAENETPGGPTPPQPPPGSYEPMVPPSRSYAAKPPNYLVWSILSTLCCCLPAGIVSIVYAAQVDSKYSAGDYTGAQDSSDKAKMWAIISAAVGFVVQAAYGVLVGLGVIGQMGQNLPQ